MNKLLGGALAGAIATVPMSVVMATMQRALPTREQYPLPPKEITTRLTEEVGIQGTLKEAETNALTMLAHYGYGAIGGAGYAFVEDVLPGRPAVKGMLFATCVWAGSYLSWLPAANILKPATEHPVRRTVLMIVAHLVWGASFGMVEARLRRGRNQERDVARRA